MNSLNSNPRSRRNHWPVTFLLLLLVTIVRSFGQGTITYNSGDNWTFPDFTPYREHYSGLYFMQHNSAPGGGGGLLTHIGRTLDWRTLNPYEDVYDFSALEQLLADAKNTNPSYGVVFRLKASVMDIESEDSDNWESGQVDLSTGRSDGKKKRLVPQWVLSKYGITTASDADTFKVNSLKHYVAPWHPGVQSEYLKFVAEFARRGYLKSPQLLGLYVHGISTSMGEELDLDNGTEAKASALAHGHATLGAAIEDCFSERLAAWNAAAGGHSYKLIWVGAGGVDQAGTGYETIRANLNDGALAAGMGHRGGFIEHYYYARIHPPKAEQTYHDASGYMTVDWDILNASPAIPSLIDGCRFWGDENEENDEYDKRFGADYTPHANVVPLLYRSSFFRAAATGMNFLWSGNDPISYAGGTTGLPAWFSYVAGKGPKYSPDAVAWLREAQVRGLNTEFTDDANAKPYRNMERLLYQRNATDDPEITPPSAPLATPYVQLKKNSQPDESFSRRTNIGESTTYRRIAFQLDPDFKQSLKNQGDPVKIMVTYREEPVSYQWMLRVAKGTSWVSLGTVTTSAVTGSPATEADKEGRWKTATFTLNTTHLPDAFVPGSALGNHVDFDIKLYDNATTDINVRYVRVVRTSEAEIAPVIKVQPQGASVLPDGLVTLSVFAKGPNLTYQWMKGLTSVSGGTKRWLERGYNDHGTYTVVVTNGQGSQTSNSVVVTQAHHEVIDDFADGNESPWFDHASTGESATLDAQATDPSPAGNSYLKIVFSTGGLATDWKYAVLKSTAADFGMTWAADGANAIRFYLKGNHPDLEHKEISFQLREGDSGERWNMSIGNHVWNNTWKIVTVPFSVLLKDPSSPAGDNELDITAVDQIRFYQKGTASRTIHVDKIEVIKL